MKADAVCLSLHDRRGSAWRSDNHPVGFSGHAASPSGYFGGSSDSNGDIVIFS